MLCFVHLSTDQPFFERLSTSSLPLPTPPRFRSTLSTRPPSLSYIRVWPFVISLLSFGPFFRRWPSSNLLLPRPSAGTPNSPSKVRSFALRLISVFVLCLVFLFFIVFCECSWIFNRKRPCSFFCIFFYFFFKCASPPLAINLVTPGARRSPFLPPRKSDLLFFFFFFFVIYFLSFLLSPDSELCQLFFFLCSADPEHLLVDSRPRV